MPMLCFSVVWRLLIVAYHMKMATTLLCWIIWMNLNACLRIKIFPSWHNTIKTRKRLIKWATATIRRRRQRNSFSPPLPQQRNPQSLTWRWWNRAIPPTPPPHHHRNSSTIAPSNKSQSSLLIVCNRKTKTQISLRVVLPTSTTI